MMALFLMLVFFVSAMIPVHGQQGFVSIDCGYVNGSYNDTSTNLTYVSDNTYIDTGKSYSVRKEFTNGQPMQTQYVRSFSGGDRNCYILNNINPGAKYLMRASFLYGNYDGEDSISRDGPIRFALYLGVNFWQTVNITDSGTLYMAEIVTVASANYFSICLVKNKNSGVPFISALELRLIDNSNVFKDVNQSVSLVFYERYNLGGLPNVVLRYPDDKYDRTWESCNGLSSCNGTYMTTPYPVQQSNGDPYDVPLSVMQTAFSTSHYYLDTPNHEINRPTFYVYFHFAELWYLNGNGSRSFNVSLYHDSSYVYNCTPTYLLATHLSFKYSTDTTENRNFILARLNGSDLDPLLNAAEAYVAIELPYLATHQRDVDAMMEIKKLYQIVQWQGDPCGPTDYRWIGINCTDSSPPRVASLNLRSHGLSRDIPIALVNLTAIQELDLSNNSLTGSIPEFLAGMASLRLLNLSCNKLSGPIPDALLERQKSGSLTLGLESYDRACYSGDPVVNNNKKKLWIILVASIVPGVAVLALIGIWFTRRTRRQRPASYTDSPRREQRVSPREGLSISPEIRRFSYLEVKAITNNLENPIGRGGFGTVYHGVLEDNTTEVAVKIRSDAAAQGTKEFDAEANLSSKVQHINLVSLVGYCEEDDHLALIYPYMDNGSLKDHLFDKDGRHEVLSWERRLKIATDAAQGLEYLHTGCAVPIIHRDVKTHNILLTKNFEAKMADFGMSKPFPVHLTQSFVTASRIVGTDGFLDPEYLESGHLHEKSDVYSFGVVLLELVTGVPAVERWKRGHIVEWVGIELDKHEIANIVDAKLQGEYDHKSMKNVLKLAMRCTMKSRSERPTMREVVLQLKKSLELEVARGTGSSFSMEVSQTSQSQTDSNEIMTSLTTR